jgi:hypothetical protein
MLGFGPRRLALSLHSFSALFAAAALGLHLLRGTLWVGAIIATVLTLVAAFILRLEYHQTIVESLTVRRLRRTVSRNGRPANRDEAEAPRR